MDLPRTPARSLDARRYAETFAVFVARSHEYPDMLRRLVEVSVAYPAGFSCLDVGAGDGMLVRDWLAAGARPPGRYVAIEPNAAHAERLRAAVGGLSIDAEVREEAFHASYAIDGRYDLVLFSHSLYWMTDPVGCVRNAAASLAVGGVVVCFLQSPLGDHPMFRLFDPLFERDCASDANHGFSSHELVAGLRAAGLAPSVVYDPSWIDLTGLFDRGNEHQRDEFISFCLQVEFAELAEPLKSDVVEYLRIACVEHEGYLKWFEPTAMVQVGATALRP